MNNKNKLESHIFVVLALIITIASFKYFMLSLIMGVILIFVVIMSMKRDCANEKRSDNNEL